MLNSPRLYTKTGNDIKTHPDAAWVIDGKGHATPLWDGLSLRLDTRDTWVEHIVATGTKTPAGFEAAADHTKGTWGWLKLSAATPTVKNAAAAAIKKHTIKPPRLGIYELIGPGIVRNPHRLKTHLLKPHNTIDRADAAAFADPFPRNYFALANWMNIRSSYVGVTWFHHDDPTVSAVMRKKDFK
jgi:hypothetical protein